MPLLSSHRHEGGTAPPCVDNFWKFSNRTVRYQQKNDNSCRATHTSLAMLRCEPDTAVYTYARSNRHRVSLESILSKRHQPKPLGTSQPRPCAQNGFQGGPPYPEKGMGCSCLKMSAQDVDMKMLFRFGTSS